MPLVTFIIPVRHQDNARDWGLLKANLTQTVASIANQSHGDWQGIIVANEGADLPELPERFRAERVTFPPNDLHEIDKADIEAVYDAFRADKGRRVLAGMLAARDSRFFMIVDDDDHEEAALSSMWLSIATRTAGRSTRAISGTTAAACCSAMTSSTICAARR